MGRRSQHTPEQLRAMILDAAQIIVEQGGLAELSARSVARKIGYAPGTLYNMFENIDDILLRVEGRMLDELGQRLAAETEAYDGADAIRQFALRYLAFAHERPRLWSLLQEHHLGPDKTAPGWYVEKLEAPIVWLEEPIASMVGNHDGTTLKRAARTLWTCIHGASLIATSSKSATPSLAASTAQMQELVDTYLAGLAALQKPRRAKPNGALQDSSRT